MKANDFAYTKKKNRYVADNLLKDTTRVQNIKNLFHKVALIYTGGHPVYRVNLFQNL